jgi:hypothetical protein
MSKDELISLVKKLKKEIEFMKVAMSKLKLNHKLDIYMQETLSYMEDIEYMKRKVKKLEEQMDRKDEIIFALVAYLNEILSNEDKTFEHHEIVFGVTEEEYKKYFLGESYDNKRD